MNFDTHQAPRPQPKPKPQFPAIVRDYLENVRGDPRATDAIMLEYLDALWREAVAFAERHDVSCPVLEEEIAALRRLVASRATLH